MSFNLASLALKHRSSKNRISLYGQQYNDMGACLQCTEAIRAIAQ